MKLRLAITAMILAALAITAGAQTSTGNSDQKTQKPRRSTAWIISDVIGQTTEASMDTLTYNYQRRYVPSLASDALATTGNLGAPSQNQLWFGRQGFGDFFFNASLWPYIPSRGTQRFYNVYIPITQLGYNWGGNRDSGQERLSGFFAGNVNRRWGFGANVDYIYSKGCYDKQATKGFSYGFTGYYRGDRVESQAFFNVWNILNKENGGITDPLYITDPAQLQGGVSKIEPKSIPVNLQAASSRVKGKQVYWNTAYKLGYWQEEEVNDTLTREIYIPVVKFIYTLDYQDGRHVFRDKNGSDQKYWDHHYLTLSSSEDYTGYWKLANTVGMSMIEGFKPWVKFNLSAFATYETRHYEFMAYERPEDMEGLDELPRGFDTSPKRSQNLFWVGGRLAKDQGAHLRYEAQARFGLVGDVAGDVEIDGKVESHFKLFGDTVSIAASGRFHNVAQQLPLQHYISNNFVWQNDFGKTRSLRLGVQLDIPWTRTSISGRLENVQNLIYFNTAGMPCQHGSNIQIVAVSLDQKLHFGIWNWNNTVTWQKSSDSSVLPLPEFTIYSNMYLGFKAFKVLDLQIGVDCDYYTRYRGVRYQPATMAFCVGDDWQIGNYPFCNAYVTAKLYKTRFYVMMTHVNQGLFGKNFFSMPLYPLNPRSFRIGLMVDFAN